MSLQHPNVYCMPAEEIGLIENRTKLTHREKEILVHADKGLRNKEIADTLFISPGTVKKHLDNIFKKLEVCNKIEALNKVKHL